MPRDCSTQNSQSGSSFPLGATTTCGGVNFSIFSKGSTAAQLLLFDSPEALEPSRVIDLNPFHNQTYHYWHVFVPRVTAGQIYGYRLSGPFDPSLGLRFDAQKVLLDPYGRAIASPPGRTQEAARAPGDNVATALRSVVVDPAAYDWEGDKRLGRSFAETIIYEMHVGGFTRHPNSGVTPEKRGTYAGLIEKIPYLQQLRISAIELLPIYAFDENNGPAGLGNYWGYQPLSFFAPHPGYSSKRDPLGAVDEFRDMVKALHRAGMEVLLDVVYNHTGEGDENGPTFCFRGLANENYYILGEDKARYADFTGCANTLNANDPIVRRLIIDSLRYWVSEMHVDGFRFDLASVLSRDSQGRPIAAPPILWDIESDPVLANVKLIAEAWDAAGLYQVGSFAGDSWKEWNGRFRDDIRGFLKGDEGLARAAAYRLTGSPDVYLREGREAEQSINFVTCHDGFTLNDLVSFNGKHNGMNGEQNRDGADNNLSWNCGSEGLAADRDVEDLRKRQIKNFLVLNLLSIGTPMLLMGDEVRRTQNGNNNAYCQNNELSWFDWTLLDRNADILRFARQFIALRAGRALPLERTNVKLMDLLQDVQPIQWHGVKLNQPDWSHTSHSLAATIPLLGYPLLMHVIVNAYWEPLEFEVPAAPNEGDGWRCCVDTFRAPPDDICEFSTAPYIEGPKCRVEPRSIVILLSRLG